MKIQAFSNLQIIITAFLLCAPLMLTAQTITVSGDIASDTTWLADTVKVTGDVTVQDDITLSIGSGTYVEFQGYYRINVKGTFIALGLPEDTIIFTINDPTGFDTYTDPGGGWGGILFADSTGIMADNDTSKINICKFIYGKVHHYYSRPYGGCILCYQFNKLIISNCDLSECHAEEYGGAVYLKDSDIKLISNKIHNNTSKYGGALYIDGSPLVKNNMISENSVSYWGGAIYIDGGSPVFEENEICYNSAISAVGIGGAIFILEMDTTIFDNNQIYNNSSQNDAGAIYVKSSGTLYLKNNQFNNNLAYYYGGAIYIDNGNTIISGNEIFSNQAGYEGGAIYIEGGIIIINKNKIYDNRASNGGAFFIYNVQVMITDNIITQNNAPEFGGAVGLWSSNSIFINNIIVNNEAGAGGAVGISNSPDPCFINNTISHNKATNADAGGAFRIGQLSFPSFKNNIIYNNISDNLPSQFSFSVANPNVDIRNCNIEGGLSGFAQVPGSVFMGKYLNNIDNDPLFEEPSTEEGAAGDGLNADWRLDSQSPCINGGTDTINNIDLPDYDYFDNDRICYGYIDIGAHEYHDSIYEFCGNLTDDMVWVADTVKICGSIYIPDTSTLTILPGVCIEFQGNFKITVIGIIHSVGTATDSIRFTAKDTVQFNNPDIDCGWGGISFFSPSVFDSSRFAYTIFEFFKNREYGGAVYADNAPKMSFSHCLFQHNIYSNYDRRGAAIHAEYSPLLIQNCHFVNNSTYPSNGTGGAIYLLRSSATIRGCVFENNSAFAGGAIDVFEGSPVITECKIIHNSATERGGGIYARSASHVTITKNQIQFNEAETGGGLYISGNNTFSNNFVANNHASYSGGGMLITGMLSASAQMINNIIVNNLSDRDGGGVYLTHSDMLSSNNTIAYNLSNGSGGAIYMGDASCDIYNSILWNNQDTSNIEIYINNEPDYQLNIYYSNVRGGQNSISGDSPAHYESSIDSVPIFRNPSSGAGSDYISEKEDWYLESVSPSVNSGIPDLTGLDMESTDILGEERVNFTRIDMGAIENQSGLPAITLQPGSQIKCEDEDCKFEIQANDSVYYQWGKDNVAIEGTNSAKLIFESLNVNDHGSYQCIIRNSYGTVYSNPVFLQVKEKPVILQEPRNTWAEILSPVVIETFARGTDLKYQWQKDQVNIPQKVTPKLTIDEPFFADEGFYRCIIYNTCDTVMTATVPLYLAPQICMVTVDPLTGHNLVIWEKKSNAPIDTFNVYRESKAAGIYDLMGTLSYDDLSIFVDTTADPTVQAYIYKITGVDTSDYETDIDLCKPHKTIHLLVSTNPELNTTQLEWDKYYGFEYKTYNILRSATGTNFTEVHSLASSLASWTDPDPLPDIGYYRITVEKQDPCYPTGGSKKADAGPYSHSMSNMEDNRLQEYQKAPTDINLLNNTIAENQSIGTLVGRFETTDADTADHHTYKLVSGQGDKDNNLFTTLGDLLITAEILDYETKDTLSVRVKSTDKGDLSVEEIFIILVTDVNEGTGNLAPTDITLSFNSIDENKPVGTLIGKFQTADPNEEDIHTYGFVEGLGGDDNDSFTILGDMLISSGIFDYEAKNQYSVRVRSRDDGDGRLTFQKSFTIYINDLLEVGIIENRIENEGLDIYPNPFSDKTVIQFENPTGKKYSMYITDLSGKVCRIVEDITTSEYVLEKGDLKEGMYFVELRGTKIWRGKIIIE